MKFNETMDANFLEGEEQNRYSTFLEDKSLFFSWKQMKVKVILDKSNVVKGISEG